MTWIAVGILSLTVVAALVLPALVRRRDPDPRALYDINVYKDQLAELERERAEGRIAESELAGARLEIERRLLAAADEQEKPSPKSTGHRMPLFISAAALPVIAALVYMQLGSPEVPGYPLASRMDVRPGAAGGEAPRMADLVKQLETRLRESPGDLRGWTLLGRSYASLGKPREAAAAYERAVELSERAPGLLAEWAEARLMARNGEFTVDIFGDFIEARDKQPTLPKPWFYIGLDKAMGGDLEGAAQVWTDLLAIAADDPEFDKAIRAQIARAASEGGFDASALTPSERALDIAKGVDAAPFDERQTTGPVAPGPSQDQIDAAKDMSPEARMTFIRSMVEGLAARLKENPNDPAGWQRLIRAYEVLGEDEKAAAARERLESFEPQ